MPRALRAKNSEKAARVAMTAVKGLGMGDWMRAV
jgi:hypothetical protein